MLGVVFLNFDNERMYEIVADANHFLTLPMLTLLCPKHKVGNILENHLNPVILVFIG